MLTNHLIRVHMFNPTVTPRFRCALLPRTEGFQIYRAFIFIHDHRLHRGRQRVKNCRSVQCTEGWHKGSATDGTSLNTWTSQELVLQWCKKTYRLVLQICVQPLFQSVAELPRYRVSLVTILTRRLTTGIRSEKRVVRRFRRCANMYLHKPRQYSIVYTHLGYVV
jgi:hypothetical protein